MSEWDAAGAEASGGNDPGAGASGNTGMGAEQSASAGADEGTLLGRSAENAADASTAGGGADTPEAASAAEAARQHQWQDFVRQQQMQHGQEVQQWRQMTADDPEIGGGRLQVSVARAQWALNRFDPDKVLGQWMEQSGLGNHPEVIRFFNRVADAVSDDRVVEGQTARAMPSLEERMYPNWKV